MQIKELRFNTQFEYIKDIRRYVYDIEEFLREKNLCDSINPVPPVPDEVEPQLERLHTVKQDENKVINILISQASLSVLFVYTKPITFEECNSADMENLKTISKEIKIFLKEKNPTFKVNYEGLILAASKTISKENDSFQKNANISLDIEEDRKRVVKKVDEEHFQVIEKSIIKAYDQKRNINPMASKYTDDNFIGWSYVLLLEYNNRMQYNQNKENISLELDFSRAKEKLKSAFLEEEI